MIRTNAAVAACATLALLLTGCGGDDSGSAAPASSSAAASPSADAQVVDNVKAGTFVVSFRSAFPALAEGRSDTELADILTATCGDVRADKPQAEVEAAVAERAGGGGAEPSAQEAAAIYQMIKLMC